MRSKTAFKTIEDFLYQQNKTFVVPNYQRGYKWAVIEKDKKESAVEKLLDDLEKANKEQQYFLQGVTVADDGDKIILIDGQQRTITLYLLLWCLSKELIKNIHLDYDVRDKSKEFINRLKDPDFDYLSFDKDNSNQDVFYFKKAIEQANKKIKAAQTSREDLIKFLKEKVTILYIVIDQQKAIKTFTMMNGSKATMHYEELVKAEMLRKLSIPDSSEKLVSSSIDDNLNDLKEIIAKDWETNALRSRYAREWDKWLYWWNKKDVQQYFATEEKPMGLLLNLFFWNKNTIKKAFDFESFRCLLIEGDKSEKQKTKHVFKELRDLQKSFEDIFNTPRIHNYLKMSLLCASSIDDKFDIINYFMQKKHEVNMKDDYAKWRLIGATHRQITKADDLKDNEESKESKAITALNLLSQKNVYNNKSEYDLALKQLLRLNVEEDNKLFEGKGRKFDFNIFGNKSLEHIHPKSKAYHRVEIEKEGLEKTIIYRNGNGDELGSNAPTGIEWLNRDEMEPDTSEHSIGNLLLLDKNENSKFNDSPFGDKKVIYFNINETFKSRNLLHTISVFANSDWTKKEIQDNKKKFIARFEKDYGIQINKQNDNK